MRLSGQDATDARGRVVGPDMFRGKAVIASMIATNGGPGDSVTALKSHAEGQLQRGAQSFSRDLPS